MGDVESRLRKLEKSNLEQNEFQDTPSTNERLFGDLSKIEKLTADKRKELIGVICSSTIQLGTGFVLSLDGTKIMVITASHVVIDPKNGKSIRDLKFYCGLHGSRTKSTDFCW